MAQNLMWQATAQGSHDTGHEDPTIEGAMSLNPKPRLREGQTHEPDLQDFDCLFQAQPGAKICCCLSE